LLLPGIIIYNGRLFAIKEDMWYTAYEVKQMKYELTGEKYRINIESGECGTYIESGYFGEINIIRSPLIKIKLRDISSGEDTIISSEELKNTKTELLSDSVTFIFDINNIKFTVKGEYDTAQVVWTVEVENNSDEYSVMEVSYPMLSLGAEYFDLFKPGTCGRVIRDAGKRGYEKLNDMYPSQPTTIPYFAVYGKHDGVYMGVEDPKGAVKLFKTSAKDDKVIITADFFGINASKPRNSFAVYGVSRWQYIEGDWYDATMIYADFVYSKAEWLPTLGRPDTPNRFKEVPYWICDYVPNNDYQRDNTPKSFAIDAETLPKDHWYKAAIELKRELDVPVAYHVYNWHSTPFNVEYPHYMPPKPEFMEGYAELKKNSIMVLPYINGVSWDTRDCLAGHEVNFENTGYHGAVILDNGKRSEHKYPQTTIEGKEVMLAPICPSYEKWHDIVKDNVRRIEAELNVDGIYIDEVSAHDAYACFNPEHDHLPGGGSHWVDGYNKMMAKINADKPKDNFYYSEGNAEPFMKSFDGMLTWMWVQEGEVPAFPAIYAGYIQMVGRYCMGVKADDYEFFKFQTAKSLLYGQQIGWYKTTVLHKPRWLAFLKKIVKLRYEHTELFNNAKMLRPPKMITNIPEIVTSSTNMTDRLDVHMEQVMAAAWKHRDTGKITVFAVNTSEEIAEYHSSVRDGDREYPISGMIDAESCIAFEIE